MADPIDEIIAGEPRPQTRKQQWASKGVPKDPHRTHQRIRASRKTRKPRIANAVLSGTFPAPLVQTVEAISDRYGVSRQAVIKRMLEDGIRKYGNSDELALANLQKTTPFDEFQPAYSDEITWDDAGIDMPQRPAYAPRKSMLEIAKTLVPSAGSPIGYEAVLEWDGEVLDEGIQDD